MDWLLNGLPVEGQEAGTPRAIDVVQPAPTCPLDTTTVEAGRRAAKGCVVVNDAGVVLGVLGAEELARDGERPVVEAMQPGPSTFRPGVPAGELAGHLRDHGARAALLTTADGRLVGLATRDDLERIAR
jgi:CBS domain-containing protein